MFHNKLSFGDNLLFEKSQPKIDAYIFPTWNSSGFAQQELLPQLCSVIKKEREMTYFRCQRAGSPESPVSHLHWSQSLGDL